MPYSHGKEVIKKKKGEQKSNIIFTVAKPQKTSMQVIKPHAEQENRRMLNITDAEDASCSVGKYSKEIE